MPNNEDSKPTYNFSHESLQCTRNVRRVDFHVANRTGWAGATDGMEAQGHWPEASQLFEM